jgi:tRNA(Ile2) C34 agmatinyltransferase TiaS
MNGISEADDAKRWQLQAEKRNEKEIIELDNIVTQCPFCGGYETISLGKNNWKFKMCNQTYFDDGDAVHTS